MKFYETRPILNGTIQALNSTRPGRQDAILRCIIGLYHQIPYINIINYSKNHYGINCQIYREIKYRQFWCRSLVHVGINNLTLKMSPQRTQRTQRKNGEGSFYMKSNWMCHRSPSRLGSRVTRINISAVPYPGTSFKWDRLYVGTSFAGWVQGN